MTAESGQNAPRWWPFVAWLALVWNAIGVVTFFVDFGEDVPAWVTAAYGIAVFAGTIGSLGLVLRRRWALPVLVLSLVAIVVQMGHALLITDLVSESGPQAAILPLVITGIAAALVWVATRAR